MAVKMLLSILLSDLTMTLFTLVAAKFADDICAKKQDSERTKSVVATLSNGEDVLLPEIKFQVSFPVIECDQNNQYGSITACQFEYSGGAAKVSEKVTITKGMSEESKEIFVAGRLITLTCFVRDAPKAIRKANIMDELCHNEAGSSPQVTIVATIGPKNKPTNPERKFNVVFTRGCDEPNRKISECDFRKVDGKADKSITKVEIKSMFKSTTMTYEGARMKFECWDTAEPKAHDEKNPTFVEDLCSGEVKEPLTQYVMNAKESDEAKFTLTFKKTCKGVDGAAENAIQQCDFKSAKAGSNTEVSVSLKDEKGVDLGAFTSKTQMHETASLMFYCWKTSSPSIIFENREGKSATKDNRAKPDKYSGPLFWGKNKDDLTVELKSMKYEGDRPRAENEHLVRGAADGYSVIPASKTARKQEYEKEDKERANRVKAGKGWKK